MTTAPRDSASKCQLQLVTTKLRQILSPRLDAQGNPKAR